jgi:HAD superfamily hydrolase (TIGR01509 family)
MGIDAVVFDLDGVLLDSEQVWDDVRHEFVEAWGGRWSDTAQQDMMGMSSPEWSLYLREQLAVDLPPDRISAEVVELVADRYRAFLPLLPGAVDVVRRLAARWPLGLASSSNRPIIDLVLAVSGLEPSFRVTVSSEEVPRGKPSPDVYLEAVSRLGLVPARCAAVEDSANGLRSAAAAGLRVIAVPNALFPPAPDALALADAVVPTLAELTGAVVTG